MVRLAGWGRSVRLPLVAAVLVVVERVLVVELGSPVLLLRVLSGMRDAWADPVVMVLALMGLLAEALAAYVLVVLALRWLCALPGAAGRLAGRVSLLVTPAAGRLLRKPSPSCLASQLDLDSVGIVNGAAVALLGAPVAYLPRYLDTLDHEPNESPSPL